MIYQLKELENVAQREYTPEQENRLLEYFYDEVRGLVAGGSREAKAQLALCSSLPETPSAARQLGYLYFLSKAYSGHKKVVLAPHDIWFVILAELAQIIKAHPEECRSLFTESADKVTIETLEDGGFIDPAAVIVALRQLCPSDVDLFLPEFSTADHNYTVASMAMFAGSLEAYYNYMTFCCGIPAIKIAGSKKDWQAIATSLEKIVSLFDGAGVRALTEKNPFPGYGSFKPISRNLKEWSDGIGEICQKIAKCLDGVSDENIEFLSGIFTQKNIGSGGELEINGWITKIFCSICSSRKIENFTATVGQLPYTNKESGREYVAAYGPFLQQCDEDGFAFTVYDRVVFEKRQQATVTATS